MRSHSCYNPTVLSATAGALAAMFLVATPLPLLGDDEPTNPIYRVTVVQGSLPAVNYGHRSAPTKIDFRGTVLSPNSKGEATVESKTGAVSIQAKLRGLTAPSQYGTEYQTFVLWAISPEGQTQRLGEVITDTDNNAKIEVTTAFQTFGLLLTAEPYFAVSKPGPVVVMENVLRPDTIGSSEPVYAKYELLSRPENYTVTLAQPKAAAKGQMVSQREYEVLLSLNQAKNAIQIARAEGVQLFAASTLEKAERLMKEAEQLPHKKANSDRIVMLARQATQTAEDARSIAAEKRRGEERPVWQSKSEQSKSEQSKPQQQ